MENYTIGRSDRTLTKQRGARWTTTTLSLEDMQRLVPKNMRECADYLETSFGQGPWAMGELYSFCDPYLFLIGKWITTNSINLATYPKLAAHALAMRNRPATQMALKLHGLS